MGRPKEHDEQTRRRLLDAAERLVDEGGPDAVSVRAAADLAETSTRAVYSLFGSKEGMLAALATRGFEVLSEYVDALPLTDDPLRDLLDGAVFGFRRFATEHPSLNRLALQRVVPDLRDEEDLPTVARSTFRRLVERIERLAATGALGNHDPVEVAVHFNALCEGLATTEFRGRLIAAGDEERVWREALGALLRGYEPRTRSRAQGQPKAVRRRRAQIRSK